MDKYTIRNVQQDEEKLMKQMNHMVACLQVTHGPMNFDASNMERLVFKNGTVFEPVFSVHPTRSHGLRNDLIWLRKYPLHLN
jgi:hypothetical protein